MAMTKLVARKIDTLVPDPRNARTHSDDQIEGLISSIGRFGWTNPVLADDMVRAGHGRLAAARLIYERGGTIYMAPGKDRGGSAIPHGTVPTIDCTGWTEDERKAYALADNQLALQAGWDIEELSAQLNELMAVDFKLDDIGFDTAALDALGLIGNRSPNADPEDVPDTPENPVSRLGDIWVLGDHRIGCGDSTDPAIVAAVLAGNKPNLMVTDPPYGVEYDASWRNEAAAQGKIGQKHATRAVGVVKNDDRADWREAWALFPGNVAYVWHAGIYAATVAQSLEAVGFAMAYQIIWAKNNIVIGRGDYHWKHEPCWYAVRKGAKHNWQGGRKENTVWSIDKPMKSETGHSTQKPIECMRRPIENNSKPGDAIYEPFSGSGTTIIAAELAGRRCLAIELNPAYVDIAVARWEAVSGRVAILEGDGRSFAEIKAMRESPEELEELV